MTLSYVIMSIGQTVGRRGGTVGRSEDRLVGRSDNRLVGRSLSRMVGRSVHPKYDFQPITKNDIVVA